MSNNGHDAYLESRVLAANPVELVHMLYQGCVQAVRDARFHLQKGDIAQRSRAINKAYGILTELSGALDHGRGGDLSTRLAQLYDYMQSRLLDANMQQSDGPLTEVLGLLATLGEAWDQTPPAAEPPADANVWAATPAPEAYAAQAWNF